MLSPSSSSNKDKHWKDWFRGKYHALHKTWSKISSCISSCKDFIGKCTKPDATGHAAPPRPVIISFIQGVGLPDAHLKTRIPIRQADRVVVAGIRNPLD